MKQGAILLSIVIGLTSLPVLSEVPSGFLNSKQIMVLIEGNTVKGQRTVEHLYHQALTARPQFTAYYRPDGQLIEVPSAQVGSQSELLMPTHGKWWSKKGWARRAYRSDVRCRHAHEEDRGVGEVEGGAGANQRSGLRGRVPVACARRLFVDVRESLARAEKGDERSGAGLLSGDLADRHPGVRRQG